MKIQKVELANKIGKLKSIVPKRTPKTALQTVLYKEGYLIASDLEITVTVKLEGVTDGLDERFLIPESMFSLIGSLPAGEVEIKAKDIIIGKRTGLELKSGKISNKLQAESADMFPATKEMGEEAVRAAIDAEDLKAGILHVLYAVGDSAANKMMESLCMDCKNGELNFTGLDGHMIAWDKTPLEGEFKLLIPKRACQQILNLDPQGKVQITSDGFTARFETEYVTIETRIVSGDFFKTERMFLEMPITAAVNRKKFLDAINRANLLRGEGQAVIISFDTDTMKIKLTNSTADYEEEVELLESINEGIKIGMDPRLLLAALKSFDSENIYINMVDPKSPMKLLSDESDLKAVVLPIAIRTD